MQSWYKVRYPNGVELIEKYTLAECDVKARAVNNPLQRVLVIELTDDQLRLIANWKVGYNANRHATDDECREFIQGAIGDLLRLVSDIWPINRDEGEV